MTDVPIVPGDNCTPACPTDVTHAHVSDQPPPEPTAVAPIEVLWSGRKAPRRVPVLVNYDFSVPVGGHALFDPETGVLAMTLYPGPVRELVDGSSDVGVVLGLSIQTNYPIAYPKSIDSLASDLVTALHENSCDHADRDCGLVESDEAIIRSVLAKHGVPLGDNR